MATYSNDAPEAGRRPAFGVTSIDDRPATSVRFERTDREGVEAYTVSFHLAGRQIMRLKDLDTGALDGVVGDVNAKAIRERSESRGTLSGELLTNADGVSPIERMKRNQDLAELPDGSTHDLRQAEMIERIINPNSVDAMLAKEARKLAEFDVNSGSLNAQAFVDGMQQRHPVLQDAGKDGQWTVQTKGPDGLFREILTTDNAYDAHLIFLQDPDFRVIDNKINDYAADHEEVKNSTLAGRPLNSLYEVRYHERSEFQAAIRDHEPNVIKLDLDRTKTLDIDVGEALDAVNALRERDRQRREVEAGAQRVDFLDQDAKRRDRGNDLDELAGRKPDFSPLVMTEHEKNRRIELTERVQSQFRVHGSEFRFKDQPSKIAFKDAGDSLKTSSNDSRVAIAMVTMAEAKGWKTISASGHPDFRREVWLEASLRGMEMKGYKPQQQDLKDLESMRERQQRNIIEPVPERSRSERGADKSVQRPQEATQRVQEPAIEPQAPSAVSQAQTTAKNAVRAYSGVLLAHGSANYKNDPQERQSYFVTMATAKGEETVWGKDLQRSVAASGAKVGETVKVVFAGDKDVTVEANKRDAQGKVIGSEPIDTRRNSWDVSKPAESERAAIVKSVAAAVMQDKVSDPAHRELVLLAINSRVDRDDKAGRLPPVRVYDHNAPAEDRGADRARPQVERNAERSR